MSFKVSLQGSSPRNTFSSPIPTLNCWLDFLGIYLSSSFQSAKLKFVEFWVEDHLSEMGKPLLKTRRDLRTILLEEERGKSVIFLSSFSFLSPSLLPLSCSRSVFIPLPFVLEHILQEHY